MNDSTIRTLLIVPSLLCLCGCSTAMNFADKEFPFSPKSNASKPAPKAIYGGTRLATQTGWSYIRSSKADGAAAFAIPTGLSILAFDVPLSLLGDTLLLPMTIPASIDRGVREYYGLDAVEEQLGNNESTR